MADQIKIIGGQNGVAYALPQNTYKERLETSKKSLFANVSFMKYLKSQKESVEAAMKLPENAANEALMARTAAGLGQSISAMQETQDFLRRRLDHAMKRLKKKELWAPDYDGLLEICEENGEDPVMAKAGGMLQLVSCLMGGYDMAEVACAGQLDDNCWMIGIELAMAEREPELFASENLFGPALHHNIDLIYVNTVMAGFASKLSRVMAGDDFYGSRIFNEIIDKYIDSEEGTQAVMAATESVWHPTLQAAAAAVQAAEEKMAMSETAREDLKKQLQEAHAKNRPLEQKTQKLEDQLKSEQRNSKALSQRISELNEAMHRKDRLISELSAGVIAKSLPELPRDDVIFIGGHPNMTKKLALDHPGWRFIDGADPNFSEFRSQPRILFFWDMHLGHPCWQRAKKLLSPSTPVAYVKSTNLDMLEDEMKKLWAPYARKENEHADE